MSEENFIKDFADQFEMTDADEFLLSTRFRDLDEWDSLTALSIIGMVHNKYKVSILGGELRALNTIEDVLKFVQSKQKS